MLSLPVIDCTDCGACCTELGNPPFMGFEVYELPEHLRDEMLAADPRREDERLPCLWLDPATRKCTNYQHRPILCRDFEVGCDSCVAYRVSASMTAGGTSNATTPP